MHCKSELSALCICSWDVIVVGFEGKPYSEKHFKHCCASPKGAWSELK